MVGRTIKKWWPVFVLPTFAAFVIGFLWPFIWGIYLSFCKFTTVQDVTFVGFSNYSKILLDSTFSHSFWLTVVFAFVSSILINVLAFFIALALTKGYRGTNAFRTVFFMPNLIGGIVLGLYLADIAEWSAFQVGTATAFTFSKKWFYRYAHSAYVAADWIYDDHLHCRSEQCIT